MNNKSVFIIIFTLFFFNTTTECMLQRVSTLIGRRLTSKTTLAVTEQDTTSLNNEQRNKLVTQAMKNAVKEELAQREVKDSHKKGIKYSRTVPFWNVAR